MTAAFLALVIAVHDGDSIKVRTDAGQIHSIRIARIDAPELKQRWGRVSGASLTRLCLGTQAWVQPQTTDRYRRTVADVSCRAKDASYHQVERGMAWVFQRYEPPSSALYAVQARAVKHRRGLWRDDAPTPPWTFRRSPVENKTAPVSTLVDIQ